jgi:hypothetical protein
VRARSKAHALTCALLAQAAALAAAPEQAPPVRLLVIDSVAWPFRDLDMCAGEDVAARAALLYQLARLLKEVAHRCAAAPPAAAARAHTLLLRVAGARIPRCLGMPRAAGARRSSAGASWRWLL